MRPTSDRIFVEQQQSESKFELTGKPRYRVVAVGPAVTTCQVGDLVLFDSYYEYEFDGKKIIKVMESDIDGICAK